MAVRAGHGDFVHIAAAFFREPDQRCVVGVVQIDHDVARITVETDVGVLFRFRIDRGGMAARASITELFAIPLAIGLHDGELIVAVLFQEADVVAAPEEVRHFVGRLEFRDQVRSVRTFTQGDAVAILLPGRAYVFAMAEEALVTTDEFGDLRALGESSNEEAGSQKPQARIVPGPPTDHSGSWLLASGSFFACPSITSIRILSGPSMKAYLILPPATDFGSSVTVTPAFFNAAIASSRLSTLMPM